MGNSSGHSPSSERGVNGTEGSQSTSWPFAEHVSIGTDSSQSTLWRPFEQLKNVFKHVLCHNALLLNFPEFGKLRTDVAVLAMGRWLIQLRKFCNEFDLLYT